MPRRDSDVAPPFDQGVFLMHYNHGREAFQQGRYAEARRELESAQKMRPDDPEVLNLLGLVYFKMGSFSEAEVIYRRLATENPSVFILHSNLGLILFKQGKIDEAESFLLRAVELRPNYAKSHLYLGLLYKQKKKLGLALEHLRFAGAEKAVKEIEQEMQHRSAPRVVEEEAPFEMEEATESDEDHIQTEPGISPTPATLVQEMPQHAGLPEAPPFPDSAEPFDITGTGTVEASHGEGEVPTEPVPVPAPALSDDGRTQPIEIPKEVREAAASAAAPSQAARKLQEAVDESLEEDRRIDLDGKIEGASRTFTLHANGFLEINFVKSVRVKRGTISSYSGNLKFVAESGLVGTTAGTLVKADGHGRLFVYDRAKQTFLLDLNDEFIYVEGGHLLALEDSLSYRLEPIYDSTYQKKIDTVKIFGKGSLAISTSIEPLTMRVNREYPLSISSNAMVAWTGNLIPTVLDAGTIEDVMIESDVEGFKIRFEGDGIVVSEQ